MPKHSKPKKINEGTPPDTSYGKDSRCGLSKTKELKIDKILDKKKEIKEKDVFDYSRKK